MIQLGIAEGWTGSLGPFTLRKNGVPFNLTGFSVEILLRRPDGLLVSGGIVAVDPDQTNNTGKVTYSPAPGDFIWNVVRGPEREIYTLRWKVTDVLGKVVTFPNGEPEEIGVYRQ